MTTEPVYALGTLFNWLKVKLHRLYDRVLDATENRYDRVASNQLTGNNKSKKKKMTLRNEKDRREQLVPFGLFFCQFLCLFVSLCLTRLAEKLLLLKLSRVKHRNPMKTKRPGQRCSAN